jgi:hypothetical protein
LVRLVDLIGARGDFGRGEGGDSFAQHVSRLPEGEIEERLCVREHGGLGDAS